MDNQLKANSEEPIINNQNGQPSLVSETSENIIPEIPIAEPELPQPELQPEPEPELPELQPEPEPEPELPQPEPQPQPEPELPQLQPESQPKETINQFNNTQPISEPTLSDFGITPKPPQNNVFKIIFIFSLIFFILAASAFTFVYFKSKQNNAANSSTSTSTKISPTVIQSGSCSLNDKNYSIGESFMAADGCNTCSCESQDTITCTDNECLNTSTATKSATTITPISTSSASVN